MKVGESGREASRVRKFASATYLEFRREPSRDWPRRRAATKVGRARHPISSSLFRIAFSVAAFTLLSPLLHRSRSSSIIPRRRRGAFSHPVHSQQPLKASVFSGLEELRGAGPPSNTSTRTSKVEYGRMRETVQEKEREERGSVSARPGFTVGEGAYRLADNTCKTNSRRCKQRLGFLV
ncbi:hypothetical protein K0M31_005601 [Melipona bicolor]|uniref:Uncharacterized protein n=1 Tax=Melipona bicolor TaxID=60889 RepID=A0AA40FTW7_9HYME|nr:hypothetical protein K0M31_005601 [Melipona bicolor]